MRILVIGDLHGRKPKIPTKDFDCMVVVGDVCDDRLIGPAIRASFKEIKKSEKRVDVGEFLIKYVGGKRALSRYDRLSLERGNEIMRYLDSYGKPIFMVAGNWDQSYGASNKSDKYKNDFSYHKYFYDKWMGDKINPKLISRVKNLRNCMFRNHEFEGVNFIGYGLSSGPEIVKKKSGLSKSQVKVLKNRILRIRNKLSKAYKSRKSKKLFTFFITHNVPYNTKLDIVKDKESYGYKKHLGSNIARDFCVRFQPEICVGGHIHENQGKDKIGKTLLVNTGFGPKSTVLVEIDVKKRKIKKVEFIK